MPKKIVITGGPSSGKTTLIHALEKDGQHCIPEISREITLQAREAGIDYLFLKDPVEFSRLLLAGRKNQYEEVVATQVKNVFFDRGIPDIIAYLNVSETAYPNNFTEAGLKYTYDIVFLLPPWEAIFTQDDERYENFDLACTLYEALKKSYLDFGHQLIEVPKGTISERLKFIYNSLEN